MTQLKHIVATVVQDESGQDLIEYALVASLVGLAAVASLRTLAAYIQRAFYDISSVLGQNT